MNKSNEKKSEKKQLFIISWYLRTQENIITDYIHLIFLLLFVIIIASPVFELKRLTSHSIRLAVSSFLCVWIILYST